MVDALANLDGQFEGKYYPLEKMTEEEQQQLIDVRLNQSQHLLISHIEIYRFVLC